MYIRETACTTFDLTVGQNNCDNNLVGFIISQEGGLRLWPF